GVLAALFSLGWALHVQFSRLALNQPGDILFGTLTFYFLLRGLRRGYPVDFVWCGVSLALSQLFFVMGRQIPLILIAYLFFIWLRQRQVITRHWRMLTLVPLIAFLLLLPQHYHMLINNEEYFEHTTTNIVFGGQLQEH